MNDNEDPKKRCTRCKVLKPHSEYFRDRTKPDNCATPCIKCRKNKNAYDPMKEHPGEKWCRTCDSFKLFSNFDKDKSKRDGYATQCKGCKKAVRDTNAKKKRKDVKKCYKCHIVKQISHFEKKNGNKTGHVSWCRVCLQKLKSKKSKSCSRCGFEKSLDNFYKDKTLDGYTSRCKCCVKEAAKLSKKKGKHDKVKKNDKGEKVDKKKSKKDGGKKKKVSQTCLNCNNTKSLSEFPESDTKKNGIDSWCRECLDDIKDLTSILCPECNVLKSVEAFSHEKKKKSGRYSTCKSCVNNVRREKRTKERNEKKAAIKKKLEEEAKTRKKECTGCHEICDFDEFTGSKNSPHGLSSHCRDCQKKTRERKKAEKAEETKREREMKEKAKKEKEKKAKGRVCTKCKQYKLFFHFHKAKNRKYGYREVCKECKRVVVSTNLKDKRCLKCKETKDISCFSKHIYSRDGYCHHCKGCLTKKSKERNKILKSRKNVVSPNTSRCAICKLIQTASNFHRNMSRKSGLSSICKPCKSKIGKETRKILKTRKVIKTPKTKTCFCCKKTKAPTDYYNRYSVYCGLSAYCKVCLTIKGRKRTKRLRMRDLPGNFLLGSKICSKCHKNKRKTSFNLNMSNKDFLYSSCKKCINNRRKNLQSYRMQKKIEMGGKCVSCGDDCLEILEFDHIVRDNKSFGISEARSIKQIDEESKKCQLLCTYCHRHKTYLENGERVKRTLQSEINREVIRTIKHEIGGCFDCNRVVEEGWESSFDFDHIDPSTKSFTISQAVMKGISNDLLQEELSKCALKCANCHRLRTIEQIKNGELPKYMGKIGELQTKIENRLSKKIEIYNIIDFEIDIFDDL